jgi:hypothetical protein
VAFYLDSGCPKHHARGNENERTRIPAHEYLGPKASLAAIVWYRYHNSHPLIPVAGSCARSRDEKTENSGFAGALRAIQPLAVLHATVTLIENLGMVSLAEGVEDAAQLAMLQSLGCRSAQGILFGYTVEADRLMDACWRPGDDTKLRTTAEDGLPPQGNYSLKVG